MDIYKSIEGRFAGLFLFSVFIWSIEILALSAFSHQLSMNKSEWASLFAAGLLAFFPSGAVNLVSFCLYQSLALIVLTLVFLVVMWLTTRFKFLRA